jgi:hypothetical protein
MVEYSSMVLGLLLGSGRKQFEGLIYIYPRKVCARHIQRRAQGFLLGGHFYLFREIGLLLQKQPLDQEVINWGLFERKRSG